MNHSKGRPVLVCVAVLILGFGVAESAHADSFLFNFSMNNAAQNTILDNNGGRSGTLSFNGSVLAGDHALTSLTNLAISFNLGGTIFTLADLSDPPGNINIRVVDILGGGQQITRVVDTAGTFTQFFVGGSQHGLAFVNADGNFFLEDRVLFDTSFHPGTYTATRVPEASSLILFIAGLLGVGVVTIRRHHLSH